jgi:hypothetical protein
MVCNEWLKHHYWNHKGELTSQDDGGEQLTSPFSSPSRSGCQSKNLGNVNIEQHFGMLSQNSWFRKTRGWLGWFILIAPTWDKGHQWNASFCFSFFILRYSVGVLGRMIRPWQASYLTQTENKNEKACMPRLGFEPTIPAFERAKAVHAFFLIYFFLFGLWDYRHCGHSWPIVPASGDNEDDCGEHDGM